MIKPAGPLPGRKYSYYETGSKHNWRFINFSSRRIPARLLESASKLVEAVHGKIEDLKGATSLPARTEGLCTTAAAHLKALAREYFKDGSLKEIRYVHGEGVAGSERERTNEKGIHRLALLVFDDFCAGIDPACAQLKGLFINTKALVVFAEKDKDFTAFLTALGKTYNGGSWEIMPAGASFTPVDPFLEAIISGRMW